MKQQNLCGMLLVLAFFSQPLFATIYFDYPASLDTVYSEYFIAYGEYDNRPVNTASIWDANNNLVKNAVTIDTQDGEWVAAFDAFSCIEDSVYTLKLTQYNNAQTYTRDFFCSATPPSRKKH